MTVKQKTATYIITWLLICTSTLACNETNKKQDMPGTANATKMKGFSANIEKQTRENNNYRKVLYTAGHMQLVLMSLKPKEEIGEEIHNDHDQFFRFESGKGVFKINDQTYNVTDGDAIIVPAGAKHNLINTDSVSDLKLYTLYSPPVHKEGLVLPTKKDEDAKEAHFDGKTTE